MLFSKDAEVTVVVSYFSKDELLFNRDLVNTGNVTQKKPHDIILRLLERESARGCILKL